MKDVKKELEKFHNQVKDLLKLLRDNMTKNKYRTVRHDILKNMGIVLFQLLKGLVSLKPIALLVWSGLVLLGTPKILKSFWASLPAEIVPWIYVTGIFVLFIALLGYITLNKMKDPKEKVFNIEAYKDRMEFMVLAPYIEDKDFSFNDLALELKDTMSKDEYLKKLKEWELVADQLAITLTDTEEREKDKSRIIEYKEAQYVYLKDLLGNFRDKIKKSQEMGLNIRDLKFFYPYSIYRLAGDTTLYLEDSVDVRGKLNNRIEIDDPLVQSMSCVKVIHEEDSYYAVDKSSISFFLEFGDGEIWVIKLHIGISGQDMLDTLLEDYSKPESVRLRDKLEFYKMNIEALYDVLEILCSMAIPLVSNKEEWR